MKVNKLYTCQSAMAVQWLYQALYSSCTSPTTLQKHMSDNIKLHIMQVQFLQFKIFEIRRKLLSICTDFLSFSFLFFTSSVKQKSCCVILHQPSRVEHLKCLRALELSTQNKSFFHWYCAPKVNLAGQLCMLEEHANHCKSALTFKCHTQIVLPASVEVCLKARTWESDSPVRREMTVSIMYSSQMILY